jgi:signal peptidase
MNNKGIDNNLFTKISNTKNKVKSTYICRFVSKILSVICTFILIFLIVVGSLMFYYNRKTKMMQARGESYTPPFGLYTIISGSMEPNIHVYDVVVALGEDDINKIKVGDVITFISTWDVNEGLVVTHRVISIDKNSKGEYELTTKGDNNPVKDGAVVTKTNLIGKVILRIPSLGKIQFFLATKIGWLLVIYIPALGIIIYDILKIFRLTAKKKKQDGIAGIDDNKDYQIDNLDNRDIPDTSLENTTIVNQNTQDIKIKLNDNTNNINTSTNINRQPIKRPLRPRNK